MNRYNLRSLPVGFLPGGKKDPRVVIAAPETSVICEICSYKLRLVSEYIYNWSKVSLLCL
jgi:hypothetical protein